MNHMNNHIENYTQFYILNEKNKQSGKEIRKQMKETEEAIKVYMKDTNIEEIPIEIGGHVAFKITLKQKIELVKEK